MSTPVQQLQRAEPNRATFANLLDRYKETILSRVPRHVNAERLFSVARASILSNNKLLQCEQTSVLLGISQIVQLGLEPNGPTGQAYLIPRWNDDAGVYHATVTISYKGLIDLALRSGNCLDVEAQVVYEQDRFSFVRTSEGPKLNHEPCFDDDPGSRRLVYAVAWRSFSGKVFPHFEIVPAREVIALRDRFAPRNRKGRMVGPWSTDETEMWRKTAVRRLAKYLQLSPEFALASAIDGGRIVSVASNLDEALAGANAVVHDEEESESAPAVIIAESTPQTPSAALDPETESRPAQTTTREPDPEPTVAEPAPAPQTRRTPPAQDSADSVQRSRAKPEPSPQALNPQRAAAQPAQPAHRPSNPSPTPVTATTADPFEELGLFLGGSE